MLSQPQFDRLLESLRTLPDAAMRDAVAECGALANRLGQLLLQSPPTSQTVSAIRETFLSTSDTPPHHERLAQAMQSIRALHERLDAQLAAQNALLVDIQVRAQFSLYMP